MTSRLFLVAALLMVGAALNIVPAAAADSVSGDRGPADKSQDRDAPFVPPGRVVPQPTPKVDTGALGRGIFETDPADALAGLTTVTLGSDGSVVEMPASESLRSIFENAVKGHRVSH